MGEINKNIKVSIVIPVYNVENYLEEALNSVIEQTLKEIEIIIVNDGSTDNSLNIINKFQKKDNRIKLINQKNKGLSEARNAGLKIAKGKYIYFMDSDDYIELDTLEKCYEKGEFLQLDFIFFDAETFTKEGLDISIYDYSREGVIEENKLYEGIESLELLIKRKKYRSAAVLNFINLNFLKKINLKFHPNILHEDELFTFLLYLYSKKVSYINRKFFKRRIRHGSIMTTNKQEKNIIGYLTVATELKKIRMDEKNIKRIKLLDEKIQDMIGCTIGILNTLDKNLMNKYTLEIRKNLKKNLKNKIKLNFPKIVLILIKIKNRIKIK